MTVGPSNNKIDLPDALTLRDLRPGVTAWIAHYDWINPTPITIDRLIDGADPIIIVSAIINGYSIPTYFYGSEFNMVPIPKTGEWNNHKFLIWDSQFTPDQEMYLANQYTLIFGAFGKTDADAVLGKLIDMYPGIRDKGVY